MRILVAGGAGYIGSHTCVELLNAGHKVAAADNLVNASAEALKRVEQITGERIPFYQADDRDRREMADKMTEPLRECLNILLQQFRRLRKYLLGFYDSTRTSSTFRTTSQPPARI